MVDLESLTPRRCGFEFIFYARKSKLFARIILDYIHTGYLILVINGKFITFKPSNKYGCISMLLQEAKQEHDMEI